MSKEYYYMKNKKKHLSSKNYRLYFILLNSRYKKIKKES